MKTDYGSPTEKSEEDDDENVKIGVAAAASPPKAEPRFGRYRGRTRSEFVMEDFECKITVSIRYSDLLFTLPSQARVLAWPLRSSRRISVTECRASSAAASQPVPFRLPYAEEALKTLSLPEAFAEIVLSLPRALKQIMSSQESE
ncbi:hypothetical protein GUJ93_ZPchr0015g6855 [Zizania palustris]|uniref:Uncharacterized protein n=1 Tax=Zizania palustris TaxID=103762 RepID=A0A8J5T928_ZIZPA|nr:hypothetical protein GUJ93_ZPchr0015g6855 [Zizania palustris]